MRNRLLLSFLLLMALTAQSQKLTAEEVLAKSIAFHDPGGEWKNLQQTLYITMSYADGRQRNSRIEVDLPREYFRLTSRTDNTTIEQTLEKGVCTLKLNGSTEFSEADKKEHRLTCERAEMMKNYYLYLYGLPMKLKDPGTRMDPKVQTKAFKGKEYLVLKVNYDKSVGEDTWYFYFDPGTYAMEVYQFFHDESINDGEYILLSELQNVSNIKMPKVRAWYYNKDDKHLGTDTLMDSEKLE